MIIKLNSTGEEVKKIQLILGLTPDGKFGKVTEAAVKRFQDDNELIPDGIVGDKTWDILLSKSKLVIGEGVIYNPIYNHITSCRNRKIKYLVIHYTAGSSSVNDVNRVRDVFQKRQASADFVVDNNSILQINPDIANYYCWAVGDGKGKYGITNKDCISIEICSNLKKGTLASVPNHEGWYFTESALNNAIKLCKQIMGKYNIPLENVIRHFDCTKKLCPGVIGFNNGPIYDPITGDKTTRLNNEQEWKEFKNKLL